LSEYRVGHGFDLHRVVEGRPLVLGGVSIPWERGLAGHSDADCASHALCDAILGAAAAGDMGQHFPSSDPRWRDASSLGFLQEAVRLVAARRFRIENVDVTLVAEAPRLAPFTEQMRQRISGALGVAAERVSIKSKSSDGLGATGRGEGIAAWATVLLSRQEQA
jgi:2-C-methyl-D-erythritol 2,4-cyclodiphosphate synthase